MLSISILSLFISLYDFIIYLFMEIWITYKLLFKIFSYKISFKQVKALLSNMWSKTHLILKDH